MVNYFVALRSYTNYCILFYENTDHCVDKALENVVGIFPCKHLCYESITVYSFDKTKLELMFINKLTLTSQVYTLFSNDQTKIIFEL